MIDSVSVVSRTLRRAMSADQKDGGDKFRKTSPEKLSPCSR